MNTMTLTRAMKRALFVAAAFAVPFAANAVDPSTAQPYTDEDQCGGCIMMITKYPGPKGQIVLKNGEVKKFCSTRCMTCNTLLMNQADVEAWLVQSAENMDWSGHDANAPHIDAKTAWFVLGSSKKATMGPSLAPFPTREAAEAFRKEFGGKLMSFDELSRESIGCPNKKKKP